MIHFSIRYTSLISLFANIICLTVN
uniref:Uncharacterized protein n=1 Tax=Arundo donax TaxID=35708 RepID=A0A0A9C865_ARUDO